MAHLVPPRRPRRRLTPGRISSKKVFQDSYGYANNLTGYTVSTWGSMSWDVQNWQYAAP